MKKFPILYLCFAFPFVFAQSSYKLFEVARVNESSQAGVISMDISTLNGKHSYLALGTSPDTIFGNPVVKVFDLIEGGIKYFFSNRPANDYYDSAWDVEFSPDQKLLAKAGGNEVVIWDVESEQVYLQVTHDFELPTYAVAFSFDGNFIAMGFGNVVEIWDLKKRRKDHQLLSLENNVRSLAFQWGFEGYSNGSSAVGYLDGTMQLWAADCSNRFRRSCKKPLFSAKLHEGYVETIMFEETGMLTSGYDGKVILWSDDQDFVDGEFVTEEIIALPTRINDMAITYDGAIFLATDAGTIEAYSPSGEHVQTLGNFDTKALSVATVEDGLGIFGGSFGPEVQLYARVGSTCITYLTCR